MDRKQANLAFHHSERLKSNLFLVSAALDRLSMASRYIEPAKTNAIEGELLGAEAEIETQDYTKAREHLAQTFSRVTTVSNEYIKVLTDEDLV